MRSEPIWHPSSSRTSPRIYVKQRLSLSAAVEMGELRCACGGPFELYVNGELAGRGLGPALAADAVWERFEIGSLLQPGENVLLIVAGGEGGKGWFRAEGEIEYADGKRLELGTGKPWQVLRADAWQLFEEKPLRGVYFAAQEPGRWTTGWFRETEWEDAAVVEGREPLAWDPRPAVEVEVWARELSAFGEVNSGGVLYCEEEPGGMTACKCVRREALLNPGKQQALVQTRDAERGVYLVLDFGRVYTGFPRLRLRGKKGGVIDLGFAQRWGEVESGLRYVADDGRQEWTGHRLESCRYVIARFSHWPEESEIDCISLVERRVEVATRGEITVSEGLEGIWGVGQRTLESCRQEIYPLMTGEGGYDWLKAYAFALNDFYLTGDMETAAAMLDSSRPPRASGDMRQAFGYALFAEAYYRYSGDRKRSGALLPGLFEMLKGCKERENEQGMLAVEGDSFTVLNALYAGALEATGHLCRAGRDKEPRAAYERSFHRVRKGLQAAWCEKEGLFADEVGGEDSFGQWANALALYFGLARAAQVERIIGQIRREDVRRPDSLLESFFLAGGLWRAGAGARALDWIEQQWGRLVEREGRTWGEKERMDGAEEMPGPECFLGSHLLGVTPTRSGYEVLEIRPLHSGVIRAEGRLLTGRGTVGVKWWHDENRQRFGLVIDLPEEGETHLAVPRLGMRFPTLTLNGETLWRNEKVYPNGFVREVISEDEWIVLVLQRGGRYEAGVE
jgi:hypothetical protein